MTEPTARNAPRAMLALITLAVDLPMPKSIFLDDNGFLSLGFGRVDDGRAWAMHLQPDAEIRPHTSEGRRYLGQRSAIEWCGWKVNISASETAGPADNVLSDEQRAALAALTPDAE